MTEDQIRAILAQFVPTISWSEVSVDDSLEEAGLDSLDKASAIMEIENATGVKIDDSAYDQVDSIAALIDLISQAD